MNYTEELVRFARLAESKGFVNALEGNLSILDRDKGLLYITPSATRKLTLTEEQVAVLELGSERQIAGTCPASSEYRLHKAALLLRSDCNAVCHSHCTYLTAYALRCSNIRIDSCTAFTMVKGEIKCVPFGMYGTPHIADGLDRALCDRDVALLGNHGAVSVGKDLEGAFSILESMEATVKTHTISCSCGVQSRIPNFDALCK